MKENKKGNKLLFLVPAIIAAFVWAFAPFIQSSASSMMHDGAHPDPNVTTAFRASLTGGAINNVTPFGRADYRVFTDNSRRLEVSVYSVNLAAGTVLNVFVNGTNVGQITVSANRSGTLTLRTSQGQTVPTVAAGNTIEVRQGTTVIASGTFSAPTTPSPTGSPNSTTRFYAPLTGAAISNTIPRGLAEYRAATATSSASLRVFVSNVNLASGTTLTVFVGSAQVGQITLNSSGRGEFTSSASTLPTITTGTVLTVRNGATIILTGTFTNIRPTPNPTGSPAPARYFEARLRGSQVAPTPVTTDARGSARILLNEAETQIQVSVGFFNLSSNQTTATINGPALPGATGATIFNLGAIGGTSGFLPVQTFTVTAEQVAQLRAGLWYVQIGSANNPAGEIRGQLRAHGRRGDFEGDGRSDISVYRSSTGVFYFSNSSDGAFRAQTLGGAIGKPVSGDYDGDGVNDAAVYRNVNGSGVWTITRSLDNATYSVHWGLSDDKAVSGDFDGDGSNDLAVFRPSNGTWYVRNSSNDSMTAVQFGTAGDVPVTADYDGDGRDDIAVFRPSNGVWYQLRSADNSFRAVQWGTSEDVPSVGDFDGDGLADVTVWRPANGAWYTLRSIDNQLAAVQFGAAGDVPVAGDFDSDEITDVAVFRPSNGFWYILRSVDDGFVATQFGTNGDVPAANN